MATIILPSAPKLRSASPRLVSNAVETQPAVGGTVQRRLRLGSRFALDVELLPMDYPAAQVWISRLVQCEGAPGLLEFPQPGAVVGAIGAPVINGAGQTGTLLNTRGTTAGYAYAEGLFFSIIHGGRRYLHQIVAPTTTSGGGAATLAIAPMLRVSPADGALMEFYVPKIEGWVQGAGAWSIDAARHVGLSFSITEAF